eukprot:gene9088-11138_t
MKYRSVSQDSSSVNNSMEGNQIQYHEDEDEQQQQQEDHDLKKIHATTNNYYFQQQKETIKQISENKFDWKLFKRFVLILKVLFINPYISSIILAVLLGIGIAQTYVSKFTGVFLANIYMSFTTVDKGLYVKSTFQGLGLIGLSGILDATIKFIVGVLAWRWRKVLCLWIQSRYFKNNVYYKIISFDDRIDNPDQRITSDIDNFTTLLATILSQCITGPLVVAYYTYLTWSSMEWYAPLIIYAYFFLGYFANKLVMSPIVSINFLQDKLEGDFRYLHQRIRNFAESITLQNLCKKSLDGNSDEELVEEEQARTQFENLLNNKKRVILWNYGLNTTSDLFTYLSPIVNYFIIALPLFILNTKSSMLASDVTIQSYNCIMLASGFSQFINVNQSISDLASYISRISTMIEVCNSISVSKEYDVPATGKEESPSSHSINMSPVVTNDGIVENKNRKLVINNGESLKLEDLSYFTPKGLLLLKNISFYIEKGTNLLIMGPSGSGKSSLIRIINGLWPFFTGSLIKPANNHLFFLPQQSYHIFGTLEEQILYPYSKKSHARINEPELRALFRLLDLEYLIDREKSILESGQINDWTHNWLNTLSPGEQQLISILGLFYHRPVFGLLDESTSSIPQSMEQKIYEIAKELGITLITVGHRIAAGGGGERVLWCSIKAIQDQYKDIKCFVYTGDSQSDDEIFNKVKSTFSIDINRENCKLLRLKKRKWVEASTYPRFTLIGQNLGSMVLGWEALNLLNPHLFIDTMGYAFTYPIFRLIGGSIVSCYVHYPNISEDMLSKISSSTESYNNSNFISNSKVLTFGKLMYVTMVGNFSQLVMVNGTWTGNHIQAIWKKKLKENLFILYPPVDVESRKELPLNWMGRKNWVLSIAQFRPEKDHQLQLRTMHQLFQKYPIHKDKFNTKLILVGSTRDQDDRNRVEKLKELAIELGIEKNVEFHIGVSADRLNQLFSEAAVGIHTMWCEHFGIGVVELMAAGVVSVAHNSGGPKEDIIVPKETGFLASTKEEYAEHINEILSNREKYTNMQQNARESTERFSQDNYTTQFLQYMKPLLLKSLDLKKNQ